MRKLYSAVAIAGALFVSFSAAAPDALAAAGNASARKPGYDGSLWRKTYGCDYNAWRSNIYVYAECQLENPFYSTVVDHHYADFRNAAGASSTPVFYYATANNYYCAQAKAHSNDGSASGRSCY